MQSDTTKTGKTGLKCKPIQLDTTKLSQFNVNVLKKGFLSYSVGHIVCTDHIRYIFLSIICLRPVQLLIHPQGYLSIIHKHYAFSRKISVYEEFSWQFGSQCYLVSTLA